MRVDTPQETVTGKAGMNALDALRYDWGSAFEIEGDGDCWRARRLDGLGGWIETESPDCLRNEIFADYALKPVCLRELDDPAFLDRRTRVRELLEAAPDGSAEMAGLAREFAELNAEFYRRASAEWNRPPTGKEAGSCPDPPQRRNN
jgi:hypothetical protein